MRTWVALVAFAGLAVAAQDKTQPPAKTYKVVNTVAGKLDAVEAKDMTLTLEISAGGGRNRKAEKVEFKLAEDVKYRTLVEPKLLDDNGKPRKPTAAEKKEWKGPDPKLPGYTAELSALKKGQLVQLQLSQDKSEPPPPKAKKGEVQQQPKLYVTMVVIAAESDGPAATAKKK